MNSATNSSSSSPVGQHIPRWERGPSVGVGGEHQQSWADCLQGAEWEGCCNSTPPRISERRGGEVECGGSWGRPQITAMDIDELVECFASVGVSSGWDGSGRGAVDSWDPRGKKRSFIDEDRPRKRATDWTSGFRFGEAENPGPVVQRRWDKAAKKGKFSVESFLYPGMPSVEEKDIREKHAQAMLVPSLTGRVCCALKYGPARSRALWLSKMAKNEEGCFELPIPAVLNLPYAQLDHCLAGWSPALALDNSVEGKWEYYVKGSRQSPALREAALARARTPSVRVAPPPPPLPRPPPPPSSHPLPVLPSPPPLPPPVLALRPVDPSAPPPFSPSSPLEAHAPAQPADDTVSSSPVAEHVAVPVRATAVLQCLSTGTAPALEMWGVSGFDGAVSAADPAPGLPQGVPCDGGLVQHQGSVVPPTLLAPAVICPATMWHIPSLPPTELVEHLPEAMDPLSHSSVVRDANGNNNMATPRLRATLASAVAAACSVMAIVSVSRLLAVQKCVDLVDILQVHKQWADLEDCEVRDQLSLLAPHVVDMSGLEALGASAPVGVNRPVPEREAGLVGAVHGSPNQRSAAYLVARERVPEGLILCDNMSNECGSYAAHVAGDAPRSLLSRAWHGLFGREKVGTLRKLVDRIGLPSEWTVISYGQPGAPMKAHKLSFFELDDESLCGLPRWLGITGTPKIRRDVHLVVWLFLGKLDPKDLGGPRIHVGVALPSLPKVRQAYFFNEVGTVNDGATKQTRVSQTLGTVRPHIFPSSLFFNTRPGCWVPCLLRLPVCQTFGLAVFASRNTQHLGACMPITACESGMVGQEATPPCCVCGDHGAEFLTQGVIASADGIVGLGPLPPKISAPLDSVYVHGHSSAEGVKTAMFCTLAAAAAAKAPLNQQEGMTAYSTLHLRACLATKHQDSVIRAFREPPKTALRKTSWASCDSRHVVVKSAFGRLIGGKGHFEPMPEDYRACWERDPVIVGTEATVEAGNFFGDHAWADSPDDAPLPALALSQGGSCQSCGVSVPAERLVKTAFCRNCSKRGFCTNSRSGLACGFPLAYGRCPKCCSPLATTILENQEVGVPGPVLDRPEPLLAFRSLPTTLVKNREGNPDALPVAPKVGRRMQIVGAEVVAVTVSISPKAAFGSDPKGKTASKTGAPVCVGPCAPVIPLHSMRDVDTNHATANGRLCPYMPDPLPLDWADFLAWNDVNHAKLYGKRGFKAPFRMPKFGNQQHHKLAAGWAKSFTPRRKAEKKMQGVQALFRQGGAVKDDLVLKGMPKGELLQASSKNLLSPSRLPQMKPLPGARLTHQSELACQRMLRYYDSSVVDALFGPDCTIAYKALSQAWSGDHFIRLGGSRKNEDVAQFFECLDNPLAVDALSQDFTLMDNSHGADAHAFFFSVMRKAGFFQTRQHAEVWAGLFPQVVRWPGVGRFQVEKGMASGAVWTTIMNTLINGTTTLYTLHKTWAENHSKGAWWRSTLDEFLADTMYRAVHAGDDGTVVGRRLKELSSASLLKMTTLGYKVKCDFNTSFLGCDPVPCLRLEGGQWVRRYCMVPVPHRFLNTLGWSLETPTHPARHVAGVGIGWLPSLSHLPGYGPLLRGMAGANGSQVSGPLGLTAELRTRREDALASEALFSSWREYSAAAGTKAVWACGPDTASALAMAWKVSLADVLAFDEDMCKIPSFPCYIGTASVHRVMAGSVSR